MLRAETTPSSGRRGYDARRVSSAGSDHLIEGSLVGKQLERPRVKECTAFEPRGISLESDSKAVNVELSIVTPPRIRSGPYLGSEDATDQIRVNQEYFWGVIVGDRVTETRERGSMGAGCSGGRAKAQVGGRVGSRRSVCPEGLIQRVTRWFSR